LDQIKHCRRLQQELDPKDYGNNTMVNSACKAATLYCDRNIRDIITKHGKADRSYYDIAAPSTDSFPPKFYLEYLNNATVQAAVGAVTNFTESDGAAYLAFRDTGDFIRGGQVEDLGVLLDAGIRVALIYGDRDYICNYVGGEDVSLAVNYTSTEAFRSAGYTDIHVSDGTIGGQVRQHGNFSFSRVYNAGHLVPAYQPLAALNIFERVIRGKAVSDGSDIDPSTYSTNGTEQTTVTLTAPPPPDPTCYLRDIRTCTNTEWLAIGNKMGTIINGIWHNSTETFFIGNTIPSGVLKKKWTWVTGWIDDSKGWGIRNRKKSLGSRMPESQIRHKRSDEMNLAGLVWVDEPKEGGAAMVGVNGHGASIAALLVAVMGLTMF